MKYRHFQHFSAGDLWHIESPRLEVSLRNTGRSPMIYHQVPFSLWKRHVSLSYAPVGTVTKYGHGIIAAPSDDSSEIAACGNSAVGHKHR
jgi:hypothetical protein